jgi:DNA adenine methylase
MSMANSTSHATMLNLPGFLTTAARPILKWAGGKSQLLKEIRNCLPPELEDGKLRRFAEPFIGGGAVFFHIMQSYAIDECFISDINEELVLLYRTVQENVTGLVELLAEIEAGYFELDRAKQEDYFYQLRNTYNQQRMLINYSNFNAAWIERAAQIIFLNRTCFNGLFRVNAKGAFNVPFGDYKNPRICDKDNLFAASRVFERAIIRQADFTGCDDFVTADTFVYFDPPYRPLNKTANFTSYSRHNFDDTEQIRLADFFRKLSNRGAKLMLSNSDPKNQDSSDNFFDDLYQGLVIRRVNAARMINSNASKRGAITELLITNYQ